MKSIDITGQRFGRLVVIKYHHTEKQGQRYRQFWLCQCDCGKTVICEKNNLKTGNTQSCGCIKREQTIEMFRKHGKRHTRLYRIWLNMKNRCSNSNNARFHLYGGKGIKVCDDWSKNFMSFYNWSMTHGYNDKLTIDRIDNNKGYSPENCRWATYLKQGQNTSRNHLLTINGKTKCIAEWARIYGLCRDTIRNRIKKGLQGENLIKPTKDSLMKIKK